MRDFRSHVAVLGRLHELSVGTEVAVAFRQGMASLAQVAVDPAAVPFEGCDPEQLRASVEIALEAGLLDDLSFLSPASAGCVLYALASALPAHASERRELGRRVLHELAHGDVDAFTSLATALALGSSRALDGALVRARLELALLLPAADSLRADALAFALISRAELFARFVVQPAARDLPARRLAARLLERAARHAVLRVQQGDDGELAIFDAPATLAPFTQLLGDRDPLVFRHVASARGLLSAQLTRYADDVERDLVASASRARRAAISLAARIAVRPVEALARARELLHGAAFARDSGIAAALIHGLARALESEPEAAEELLHAALERGGLLAAEALIELRRDLNLSDLSHISDRVAHDVRMQLHAAAEKASGDEGQLALIGLLLEELDASASAPSVPLLVREALMVHARRGPAAALGHAQDALALAERKLARLAQLTALLTDDPSDELRAEIFRLVQELERGLLESSALRALLSTGHDRRESAPVTQLLSELGRVLVRLEQQPHTGDGRVVHLTFRMRSLRALLHALDAGLEPDDEQQQRVRAGQLAAVCTLCDRVAHDRASAMDRIVHAALARGVDALLRDEVLELGDMMLCLAGAVPLGEGLSVVAECSLLPELTHVLRALSALMQDLSEVDDPASSAQRAARGLSELAHALPSDDSPRTEALRRALLALVRASEAVLGAPSLRALTRSRRALSLLEGGLGELAQLVIGARKRLGLNEAPTPLDARSVASLTRALESGVVHGTLDELVPSLEWLTRELDRTLPPPLARALSRVLERLSDKPLDGTATDAELLAPATTEACPLPAWVPPSRRLGGFFVTRSLGTGLASSVFLVKRTEQRADRSAKELALKVARYDGRRARVLNQAEFEAAFARELPALLSIPPHENLAACVAVEPTAQPRPFLVMEWVDGPTLARVRKRKLAALQVIDGILAGLEVLHARGIGHLDLAPCNVILRMREGVLRPVLVDFGCAGRHVRPGVGQAPYAAPELWSDMPSTPMAVDVYALGCLAYEVVTGRPLFEGDAEHVLAAEHVHHDGAPPAIAELALDPRTASLGAWFKLALRADPRARASVTDLRAELRRDLIG